MQSAFEPKPDILITDVLMGELSGIELAKFFRHRLPECRVILFSGQIATDGLLKRAKIEGYEFEALPKPVSPRVFLEMLSEMPQQ
jgi:DNA-binding NtrC family response regulator